MLGLGLALLAGAPVEIQQPHDEPPTLALTWSAAETCPSRAELLERIRAQGVVLGEWIPDRHARADLEVTIEIASKPDVWQVELELVDDDGRAQRSFTASDCEALADAVALIVAVTLDPIAVTRALEARTEAIASSTEAEAEPAEPVEPIEPIEPPPEPPPDPLLLGPLAESGELGIVLTEDDDAITWPANLEVGVSIVGGGGYGPTRTGYGLIGGRLALLGPAWRVDVGGHWATPRRIAVEGAAARFDAWRVEARGCWVPTPGPVELPLCVGVELGSVRGRGLPPTPEPTSTRFFWVAPTLSQGLIWAPVERFAFGPELGLVSPLTRGRFVAGALEIDRLARIGVRGLLVLELRLP
jgi:hypothetical protein